MRQPASALRELISNAYDADATRVVIKTDAPRFERITVEDDGSGMTPEVLEHLLEHIGGSAKRNQTGAELGITEHDDPMRSPKGRRLIGKIGIGLFSVSQLTHSFQIVTKVKGDSYRTIATVALRQFSDFKAKAPDGSETQFESGKVKIWRAKASDKAAHGTTITLTAIRRVANEDSIAWSRVFKLGPFDVINLDLCDGFGTAAGSKFNDTYYNAIAHLLALQARQKTPWLLLLTTRVGNAHVDTDTFALMLQRYAENLDGCADFKTESQEAFSIHDKATLDSAVGTEVGVQWVFLTGICKWLLGMAIRQDPPSIVEVKSVLGYRVEKDAAITDLVSVAIRFSPQHSPAEDPSQISKTKKNIPDECALAVKALKRVSKLGDVDHIMGGDRALRDSMFEKMKLLLGTARYDVDAYAAWDAQQ